MPVTLRPLRQAQGTVGPVAELVEAAEPLLTLCIPMRAMSLNRWMRLHWAAKRNLREQTFYLVRSVLPMAVIEADGFPVQAPARIVVTATMTPPVLDADNLVVKDIIDSLRGWVMPDDDARFVTSVMPVVKRGKVNAVTVDVFPIAEVSR